MRLKIDNFYHDRKLGALKFKGELEGNLIFDNHIKFLGKMNVERVTLKPDLNRKRISRLRPIPPPE